MSSTKLDGLLCIGQRMLGILRLQRCILPTRLFSFPHCLLQLLLDEDADVNAVSKYGDTPLHLAAYWGHLETAKASQGYHLKV